MTDVSAAALLIDTLRQAGVKYLFANFGSDHPAIIEALAADRERGINTPAVVLCPHELSAISAAHAYAAVTGEPQAVFVHTDVGTANLGGGVHNAARSRVPVFIFAGLTPFTLEGELPGTRNSYVNSLQDVHDQQSLVRPYVKWSYDVRTGRNVPQIVLRALQLAKSAPAGPVYITGAREVLAETVPRPHFRVDQWSPVSPVAVPDDVVSELVADLEGAENPVLITSYLGSTPASVDRLVRVADRFGLSVVEYNAQVVNFPREHPGHVGDDPYPFLKEADVVIAIDSDEPWLHSVGRPRDDAKVYVVNEDPLQEGIPLWYAPATKHLRASSAILLDQVLARDVAIDSERRDRRARRAQGYGDEQRETWSAEISADVAARRLTSASVAHAVSTVIDDETIVLNETISAAPTVWKHLPRTRPGSLFGNRGSSLGWSGGGAIGVKMAARDRTVVSLVGDGTFFLTAPSSTYWMADRYDLPWLTVVLDNGGWNATKRNLVRQHANAVADSTDRYWVNLQQTADFSALAAAAGNAWGRNVTEYDELEPALREGLEQVAAGRSALVCVRLDPISQQPAESV